MGGEERIEGLARRGSLILTVSGGRDSAAAAYRALEILRERGIPPRRTVVLYAHTPLALPENLDYVKRLAAWLGARLLVARPREGLEAIARRGWPYPHRRWCMYRWKIEPMIEAIRSAGIPTPHIHVVGVRLGESRRRLTVYQARDPREPWFYCLKHASYCAWYWAPILDWSDEQVREYIRERGIPRNPLWSSSGHSSHDCTVCLPFARRSDYARLKAWHPDLWQRLLDAYRRMRTRRPGALAWRRLDLEEVARARTLEDYPEEPPSKCRACLVEVAGPGGSPETL